MSHFCYTFTSHDAQLSKIQTCNNDLQYLVVIPEKMKFGMEIMNTCIPTAFARNIFIKSAITKYFDGVKLSEFMYDQ